MERRIIIADEKNIYRRYYDETSLRKIIDCFYKQCARTGEYLGILSDTQDFVEYGDPTDLRIKNIAFKVHSLRLEGYKSLIASIEILESPKGIELASNIDSICFRSNVWGFLQDDGKVNVEQLISINAINKRLDPFRNVSQVIDRRI